MSSKYKNKQLEGCSKELLIYMIQSYEKSLYTICEICVSESKSHIESKQAVEAIRKQLGVINDIDYLNLQESLNHLISEQKN